MILVEMLMVNEATIDKSPVKRSSKGCPYSSRNLSKTKLSDKDSYCIGIANADSGDQGSFNHEILPVKWSAKGCPDSSRNFSEKGSITAGFKQQHRLASIGKTSSYHRPEKSVIVWA